MTLEGTYLAEDLDRTLEPYRATHEVSLSAGFAARIYGPGARLEVKRAGKSTYIIKSLDWSAKAVYMTSRLLHVEVKKHAHTT